MNKAITDGILLMPPSFETDLAVWSDQDGTPGSTTYDGSADAAIVPADADFGACLELYKSSATQKLRYMGQTPLLPGCYIQVKARVKAMSGNLPSIEIAGWAGDASQAHVAGKTEIGTSVTLNAYGEIVEISAIIGAGNRQGVDMIWGAEPIYGHFGLNLTGATGGVVRVEDIEITDVTHVFHRKMMDWVDVRDYGAIGDGLTDDLAAFQAADTDAGGRHVLISQGNYYLSDHFTFNARARFEGTVTMDEATRLILLQNYDLPSYIEAFGNEELGFRKALQALFNFTDHDSLDMCGRRVKLSEPLDVHAAVNNVDSYSNRRVLRNGQIESDGSAAWDTDVVTSLANYDAAQGTTLSNVANISQIPVGSLVEGSGVGREVYVRAINVAAGTLTLSSPLYAAPAQQNYTFSRFKYLLDLSGFSVLQRFNVEGVEFLCQGNCSGVMLPDDGKSLRIRDCYLTAPKDRGVTSAGKGCAGLTLDGNEFLSNEQALNVGERTTIGFNTNSNDVKLRGNRVVRFKHFGVLGGAGNMISANHIFQGDNAQTDDRTAGLVLTAANCKTIINGNYIDNCSVDWSNEHDADPSNNGEFSFGSLTVDANIFYSIAAPSWFRFLRIKPCGAGHTINGLNISGNTFKQTGGGNLDRVDIADASIAPLNRDSFRNIIVEANTYNAVNDRMYNPAIVEVNYSAADNEWVQDMASYLPFGGKARRVVSMLAHNQIKDAAGQAIYTMPYAVPGLGANGTEIKLRWPEAVSGKVYATVRVDNPV